MRDLYSVYDRVSDMWQDPIVASNDKEASRGFILSCSNPGIPELYLADIALYHIGMFDELTGEVIGNKPRRIMDGDDLNVKRYREVFKRTTETGGNDHEISHEENCES